MQTRILQASADATAPGTQPPTALAKVVIFPGVERNTRDPVGRCTVPPSGHFPSRC